MISSIDGVVVITAFDDCAGRYITYVYGGALDGWQSEGDDEERDHHYVLNRVRLIEAEQCQTQ